MARAPRLHAPGALYHVMLRGNFGDEVFFTHWDRGHLEALVAEGVERFGHRIHAYCWMTNHLHLAVQVADVPLARIIHNLAFRHARRINRRRDRLGHLFQGRYKALLVDRDRYLLALVRYIHLNPVRAGLVAAPEGYPWSSHRAYLGLARTPWLSTALTLACFGGNERERRRCFKAFVDEELSEVGGENGGRHSDTGELFTAAGVADDALKATEPPPSRDPSIDHFRALVCGELGVGPGELRGTSRARLLARARYGIALLALDRGCGSLAELGRLLGRDPAVLQRGVARLRMEMERDLSLRRMIARWSEAFDKR